MESNIINYGKGRIIVTSYSVFLGWLFIDILGLKYIYFAAWFIPVNFVIGYYINKKVFTKKLSQ